MSQSAPEQQRLTQVRNIEAKTGKDLAALSAALAASGKVKHGEARAWFMEAFGLGYGDANTLAHFTLGDAAAGPPSADDALAEIYAGKKAHLRAVHDAVVSTIAPWGAFEIAPKKGYVSLRRKKQFAMLGPKTAERSELGLNLKDPLASDRFTALKAGGMCQYAAVLATPGDVDDGVVIALRRAFDAAG